MLTYVGMFALCAWHMLTCVGMCALCATYGSMWQHVSTHAATPASMCRWWCKLHAATYANTCRYVFGHHTPTHMHTHKHTHCQSLLLINHPMLCLWQNTAISTARHAALYTHGCYNIALLAVFVAQHCYTATHATH